jgi:hypothetical protein
MDGSGVLGIKYIPCVKIENTVYLGNEVGLCGTAVAVESVEEAHATAVT